MRICLFFLCLSLSFFALAQSEFYTKNYTPQQLQEDFQIYQEVFAELHPSLYWYTPKEELDQMIEQVEEQLSQPLTKFQFFNLVAPITAKINCGHTGTTSGETTPNRMPLEFRYLSNELYLYYDYETQEKSGKTVKRINGHEVEEMIEKISNLQGTDGFIETPKPLFFNNSLSFGYRYHLIYPEVDTYKIELEDGTTITRNAISEDRLKNLRQAFYPKQKLINYEIKKEQNTAILTINTFEKGAFKSAEINYKKYIEDFFKMIKKANVEQLIIDLRQNGGGEDNYASYIYRFLTDQTFQYYKSMEINSLPYNKEILQKVYVPSEVSNAFLRKLFIKKKGDRFLVRVTPKTRGLRKQRPKRNTFQGQLYFLISGNSYSASAELTAYCQAHRPNTTFVGQETGGAIQGNTSAVFAYLTLPNTRLGNYIPLVRYSMNISNPKRGRGIEPDYPIEPTVKGILAGKDEELEFTLELIQQSQ
ncbi:MAG: S41 family peptidase [Bacteroidota bacterium]